MNSAIGRNLMWQSVRVDTLQFVQLAILDDQLRQLISLCQLLEHGLAGGNAARRSFAPGTDIQIGKNVADLLWGTNVEFMTGQFVDLRRQLRQLLPEKGR